jgi:hypothetical protein
VRAMREARKAAGEPRRPILQECGHLGVSPAYQGGS